MAVELLGAYWLLVGDFLRPDEEFALLALSRAWVFSPLRRRFFVRTVWRIPPIEAVAFKMLIHGAMMHCVRSVSVTEPWQQSLLNQEMFPSLESIHFESDAKMLIQRVPSHIHHVYLDECGESVADGEIAGHPHLKTLTLPPRFDAPRGFRPDTLQGIKTFRASIDQENSLTMELIPKLSNLRALHLSGDFIKLDALVGLEYLQELTIQFYHIPSIDSLATIAHGLTKLHIKNTSISNEVTQEQIDTFISSLVNITKLKLPHSHSKILQNVTPLIALTKLKELYVHASYVIDLSPLATLQNLQKLDLEEGLDYVSSSSQRALEGLPKLTTLVSRNNSSTALARFQFLHLKSMSIIDHEPVIISINKLYPRLEKLSIETTNAKLENIAICFPMLRDLKLVIAYNYDRMDLSCLGALERLTDLTLWVNGSVNHEDILEFDYSFLQCLKNLKSLNLRDSALPTGAALFNHFRRLRKLVLRAPVRDISFVQNMKLLREFDILDTSVEDISSLRHHPRLSSLRIPGEADCRVLFSENGHPTPPFIKKIVHGREMRCLWRHGLLMSKASLKLKYVE